MITKADKAVLLWLSVKWIIDIITLYIGIGPLLILWIEVKLVIDFMSILYLVWRLTHNNNQKKEEVTTISTEYK